MNSAPWAKLTTPNMPNTMVSPSAVMTSTAPRAMPENSCMMISERSIRATGSGRVAEFAAAPQQVFGTGVAGDDREQIVVIGHRRLLLGLKHQHRLHRLMVAFAILLRPLGQVIFERLQRGDHLVGLGTAGRLHGLQQRANAGIAIGAVVGRNSAA